MISESKVILLPPKGIYLQVTFPEVPRFGIMADNSLLSWNHAPSCSAWNCAYQLEPLSSVSLHPSRCMLRVSAREMLRCLTRELILSCSIFEKIDPSRVSFSSRCHVGWSSQSKTTRQRWWLNQRLMKCNLDREDYVSLRFPFILPYAWISGRDFCLVGVSCHIPGPVMH